MADTVPDWGATSSFAPSDGPVGGFGNTPRTTIEELGNVNSVDYEAVNKPKADYTGCTFCKSMQHRARECPDRPDDFGKCFACGGDHLKADCPEKPAATCKICRAAGHDISECTANRLFMAYSVDSELTDTEAWDALQAADEERDLDNIKAATFSYAKAAPGTTIESLQEAFRRQGMNTHLIAKQQTVNLPLTYVNFQGNADQKYVATFQFSAKPRRLRQDEGWPSSPEENMERLTEAGFVVDSMVTICRNCGETGHIARACEQEKVEVQRIQIQCSLCDAIGHRARDCQAPRRKPGKPRECRICSSTDHLASECTEKPARTCRNCDSTEHESKECDQPKDWSRVTCNNCGEKGHGVKRCKKPIIEEQGGGDGYDRDNGPDTSADANTGGW